MQTFLPYADFAQSASVLDRARIGKQRVENLQILKALSDRSYGWQNHPAVKMWRGYEYAFRDYHRAICAEWTGRGYKDTCLDKFNDIYDNRYGHLRPTAPFFIGNTEFHESHQSNLLRKDFAHYSQFFSVPADLDYVWPV